MAREWSLSTWDATIGPPQIDDGETFVEVRGDNVEINFEADCCNGGTHSEHRWIPLDKVLALLNAAGYDVKKREEPQP